MKKKEMRKELERLREVEDAFKVLLSVLQPQVFREIADVVETYAREDDSDPFGIKARLAPPHMEGDAWTLEQQRNYDESIK